MLSVSQEVNARTIRQFFNPRERFDVQYRALAFGLLVNIDRSDFRRFSADLHSWRRAIVQNYK
jgi:hypothetical protein